MPIYTRKGSTESYRVVEWANNRRHERIVRGTKKDAQLVAARMRLELKGSHALGKSPRLGEFVEGVFEPRYRARVRATTWQARKYLLADVVDAVGASTVLNRITFETIERVRAHFEGRGNGPGTVNVKLRALSQVLKLARKLGLDASQPAIEYCKEAPRRVYWWTLDECRAVLDAALRVSPATYPLVLFGLNTGLRKSELIHADWRWIDRSSRMLRVQPTDGWLPKSGRCRDIPLSDVAWDLLSSLQQGTTGPLFPTRSMGRRRYWPESRWDAVISETKLPACGPHTMRHTFAAHFLSNCPDIYLLSQILGHSDTETTRLYAHLLPDHMARARNAVNIK